MDYISYITKQLQALTAIPSPSSYTHKVVAYVRDELNSMGYSAYEDKKHSLIAEIGGEGSPLLITAHIDTLGCMVRAIKPNGRLRLTAIGGFQWGTADGENCHIHTRDGRTYTGVIMNTTPSCHVSDTRSLVRNDENLEVLIDEMVSTKEEVLALGIMPGDIVSVDPKTVITPSGYIKSRYLDNKMSSAILMGLAKMISEEKIELKRKVTIMFTSTEEIGTGACHIPEDTEELLCVDMGCVGEDLSCTEQQVSICAKDSGGPYDYDMVTKLIELAKKYNIDYAVDVYPHYGSDAEATIRAGYEVHYSLIGAGIYASHNYERSHINGMKNTFELLKAFVFD